ncbi:hypothetical protein DPEC_G00186430 [Dallia pectoralis]|uniref:Uncharacterized protein n=1 Tax=Dallia pectoralis TaxID=75939 RepID=A0ACC2GBM9_DALPE|nr:hypothetical protein DPEC_G00186430 [Dallia pectoralis]
MFRSVDGQYLAPTTTGLAKSQRLLMIAHDYFAHRLDANHRSTNHLALQTHSNYAVKICDSGPRLIASGHTERQPDTQHVTSTPEWTLAQSAGGRA